MSLAGMNPAPLNVDPTFAPSIRGELAKIASSSLEWQLCLTDDTFYALIDRVADGLHMGQLDFPEHDQLIREIRAAHDQWLDIVDPH
jgi:hypothetical protein